MSALIFPAPAIMIGCGNMGRAILPGFINTLNSPDALHIAVHNAASQADLRKDFPAINVHTASDIEKGALDNIQAHTLLYAAKPQGLQANILAPYQNNDVMAPEPLIISVAAGALTRVFSDAFHTSHIIRIMPNTPAMLGKGVAGIYAPDATKQHFGAATDRFISATGTGIWVEHESLMHLVTAVSGSGPAYAFHFAECWQNKGIDIANIAEALRQAPITTKATTNKASPGNLATLLATEDDVTQAARLFCQSWSQAAASVTTTDGERLPAEKAALLVTHTLTGAAAMLEQSGESATTLRERVTSKGGTTAAGLAVLMEEGVRNGGLEALMHAVITAASQRSEELGK